MASPAPAPAEAAGPDGTMFDYPVIEEMDPSLGKPRMPFLGGGTAHTHSTCKFINLCQLGGMCSF